MAWIVLTVVDMFASTVLAAGDVKLELSVVIHLVVGIEWAQEHLLSGLALDGAVSLEVHLLWQKSCFNLSKTHF